MTLSLRWLLLAATLCGCSTREPSKTASPSLPNPYNVSDVSGVSKGPLIIGHRGASGHLPEHTLEAYDLAITQGAHFIEPDLVATRDGVLVARHENRIDETTDVATKFPHRKTTKTIDGKAESGWFTEDFTLLELKSLRARERLPFRNLGNDGKFDIPTFREVIALAQKRSAELGRTVGVYPETKHPTYFRSLGLPLEEPLLRDLEEAGWNDAAAPVFIQSFEVGNLRTLATKTRVRLVQLVADGGAPWDFVSSGSPRTYASLLSPEGLAEVKSYAAGVGLQKPLVFRSTDEGRTFEPTGVVDRAHGAGLLVHVWTFRDEDRFLTPLDHGRPEAEVCRFALAGVDGMFTDFPDTALKALAGGCGG
jgi:glycerophosphoryl diester phosphodiesterase